MTFYEFLTDPRWDSIGVFVGAIGVFGGAWLGTQMANYSKDKDQKQELSITKQAYEALLNSEIRNNKEILQNILKYLQTNPPIYTAFDAVKAGSLHLRFDTWNNAVAAKVSHAFTHTQRIHYEIASQSTRTIARIIDMEVADWRRVYDFNEYYENHPSYVGQRPHNHDVLSQIKHRLEQDILDSLRTVNSVDTMIRNHWVTENQD